MVPDIFDSGDIDLKKIFGNRGAGSDAQTEDMDLIARIKAILGPFVLRRVKSDVMRQLVAKTQKVFYFSLDLLWYLCKFSFITLFLQVEVLEMLADQAEAYKEAIEEYRTAAHSARSMKAATETPENASTLLRRRQISNYFTQFRKVCLVIICFMEQESAVL